MKAHSQVLHPNAGSNVGDWNKSWVLHCLDKVHKPLYERVEFSREYFSVVLNNMTLPVLLGYRDIYQCPKCDKVILGEPEITDMSVENSICCDTCSTWWHLPCANLSQDVAESLESWICYSCLADVADIDSGSDSYFDHLPTTCTSCDIEMDFTDSVTTTVDNAVQTNSGLHELADPVVLCSVCSLQSIPVGQEHICTICYKRVHAWCSNHEDITRPSDFICKWCQT